jgi:hypothetical protein
MVLESRSSVRLRPLVLATLVAYATAVAIPSPALAATTQCSLVMPTKVVLDAKTVTSTVRLGSNCSRNDADHAYWDLVHSTGKIAELDWLPEDFADGVNAASFEWYDADPKGRYTSRAVEAETTEGARLTQNSPVTLVKYASRLSTSVTRTSTRLTWSVRATQWSGAKHAYVPRAGVNVGVFHRATPDSDWRYVKSVTTSSTGRATVNSGILKPGLYRLKVAETPTVWAAYSPGSPGRIG